MVSGHHDGFTLVELSIVLVIIGLIVGGVLVGKDLIRAAELRSIASEKERFLTAVYSFKTKYNAVPGDFTAAQTIWGAAASCTTAQTTTATCNGDGDGSIERRSPSGSLGNESFLFWKHLANAGLVPGSYTGVKDGSNIAATTVNNAPQGKIAGSLWYIEDWGIQTNVSWAWNGKYLNCFEVGLLVANSDPWGSFLTAAEMSALDAKIDDGKPGSGSLVAARNEPECAVKADGVSPAGPTDGDTAIYKPTSSGYQCFLTFRNIF